MSKSPILNIADVQCVPFEQLAPKPPPERIRKRFGASLGLISRKLGAQKLGYNLTVIAPGKRAFPFHNHRINEEMFFILEGSGELRLGGGNHPLRAGDVVACPAGGPETAHQIVNTSDRELKILAVSTVLPAEVCEYPDSGKFAASVSGPEPGSPWALRLVGRGNEAQVDYWDGE